MQGIGRIVRTCFEHRSQARTVFDQGADARALVHPLLELSTRVGLQPSAVVHQAFAQLAGQQRAQPGTGGLSLAMDSAYTPRDVPSVAKVLMDVVPSVSRTRT